MFTIRLISSFCYVLWGSQEVRKFLADSTSSRAGSPWCYQPETSSLPDYLTGRNKRSWSGYISRNSLYYGLLGISRFKFMIYMIYYLYAFSQSNQSYKYSSFLPFRASFPIFRQENALNLSFEQTKQLLEILHNFVCFKSVVLYNLP